MKQPIHLKLQSPSTSNFQVMTVLLVYVYWELKIWPNHHTVVLMFNEKSKSGRGGLVPRVRRVSKCIYGGYN